MMRQEMLAWLNMRYFICQKKHRITHLKYAKNLHSQIQFLKPLELSQFTK
jgi:hypothetical protein